jgi:3-isopropylmalate dehydratase small subunit
LLARNGYNDTTVAGILRNGLDDIALTLQHEDKITAYEAAREQA